MELSSPSNRERYRQGALALDPATSAQPAPVPTRIAAGLTDGGWVARHRHTATPSGRRLPGDLWEGYRFECATRDRLALPEVGLAEFRDLRDWADRFEEDEDDDHWITEPDTDAPPYGHIGGRQWRWRA